MNWQAPAAAKNGKAPVADAVLWSVRDCMNALGVGRTKLWELDKAGQLGPKVYIGVSPKWRVDNVLTYAAKGDVA
jgi:hypothetical protein